MREQRDSSIDARFVSWSVWIRGGSGFRSSLHLSDVSDTYQSFVPVDNIECSITDDAINHLPIELRDSVHAAYLRSSTLDQASRILGVHRTTLFRRLCHADKIVSDWLVSRNKKRLASRNISVLYSL